MIIPLLVNLFWKIRSYGKRWRPNFPIWVSKNITTLAHFDFWQLMSVMQIQWALRRWRLCWNVQKTCPKWNWSPCVWCSCSDCMMHHFWLDFLQTNEHKNLCFCWIIEAWETTLRWNRNMSWSRWFRNGEQAHPLFHEWDEVRTVTLH